MGVQRLKYGVSGCERECHWIVVNSGKEEDGRWPRDCPEKLHGSLDFGQVGLREQNDAPFPFSSLVASGSSEFVAPTYVARGVVSYVGRHGPPRFFVSAAHDPAYVF